MQNTVTLELPENIRQTAEAVADQTHRRLEDVLVEWLNHSAADLPVELLPNDQVVRLAASSLDEALQIELSMLLARNREEQLAAHEQERLDGLMRRYRLGLVLKARATYIAVERGLLPALN
jgi:diphthamide synthase subunit DPH2